MKEKLVNNLRNLIGWKTNRKIIVFESDDWGMIRMASSKAQNELKTKGYNIQECPYNSNDRLESDEDITMLSKVLLSVKDRTGNPVKFTLNNIVANPDYTKIEKDNFRNYHYEHFTETLKKQGDSQNVISLIKKGITQNIFQPQLHGREHINLRLWLARLRDSNSIVTEAFKHKMYTVHRAGAISGRRDNLDSFGNATVIGDDFDYSVILKEAQEIFQDTWGFKSESFIAPCYIWHPSLEEILKKEGIKFIQGSHVQVIPSDNISKEISKKYHFTGQKNKLGQRYLVRNCFFEPAESGKENAVEKTLKEIKSSFLHKTPAIISSHRVNYIGSLNPENRNENLKLLEELLSSIIKIWPNVEFMSSDQLGNLITKKK